MVLTKERFDIKYALAEVVTDKRCVELLKWRSEERLIIWRKIITVIYANFSVAKVIPVQHSTNNDCSILCSLKNLTSCIVDGMHTIKTWTGLMKWNSFHQGAWIWKTFRYWYYLLGSFLMSDDNVSLLQPIKTSWYSLCSKV